MTRKLYIPRGGLPLETFDASRWPPFGRVGFCRQGPDWKDCFVSVMVGVDDDPPIWLVVATNSATPAVVGSSVVTDIADTDTDGWLTLMLTENPVEWAPDELDDLIEDRIFGSRRVTRQMIANGNTVQLDDHGLFG